MVPANNDSKRSPLAFATVIKRAIGSRSRAKLAGLLVVGLALTSPLSAQDQKEPDVKDVATTPLQDLGVMGKDIPEVLQIAAQNPYASIGLTTCNDIVAEVAKLDTVLGEDYDIAGESKNGLSVGKAAKSVVGSIIPFRGVVREVSGAAGDDRKMRAAIVAGMVRRGYLKGLGHGRGCKYPARPKPVSSE